MIHFDASLNGHECDSQSQVHKKAETFLHFFSQISQSMDEIWSAANLLVGWSSYLCLLHVISTQGKELLLSDFIKYTFNIGLHLGTYEPSSVELGIVVDMTKPYVLMPVWMSLTFAQSQG